MESLRLYSAQGFRITDMRVLASLFLFCLGVVSLANNLPIGATQAAPERYSDVPENHWAYEALKQATALGILTGYPDQTFQGSNTLSRYEAAIIAARLLNYTDGLINVLSGDPEFATRLREASTTLAELGSAEERIRALERSMQEAASLTYVQSLEARIVELERSLNDMLGEERFPAGMTNPASLPLDAASSAAASAASGPGLSERISPLDSSEATSAAADTPDSPLPGISFQERPEHPFYFGFSPGILTSSGTIYVAAQLGYDGIVGPLGANLRLSLNSDLEELRLTTGPTVRLQVFEDSLSLYGGLAAGISIRPGDPALLIEFPFGAEYLITPQVGLFAVIHTSYGFKPINKVDAQLSTGINLRF